MNKLTKTLTISAMTAALAGGFGFANAQSASTGNGSTGNPDPNATLGAPVPSDSPTDAGRRMDSINEGVRDNTPGALTGEAADSNHSYGNTRPQPGFESTHELRQSPTRGESARSNNSYGNSRTTPQSENR